MKEKNGYAGKITHGSTQNVQAPFGGSKGTKGNVVYSGNDLRTGKKKSK